MMQSQKSKLKRKLKFEAIGTGWEIDYTGLDMERNILDRIDEFDKTFSRFRPDSLVSKMSKKAGVYKMPADGWTMLSFYKDLYDQTDGLVTPLIGNVLEQAGYDASYSLKEKTIEKPLSWDEALEITKETITIKKPVLLDFGAAGKGYLIDIVGDLLKNSGVSSFSIDAGGDILLSNFDSTIGLENPRDASQVIGTVKLSNGSIAGSSGNRRNWGKFHHIINPQTLKSTEDVEAVWTIGNSAMLADGLSTCLFFVDAKKMSFNFEYLILYSDFTVKKSNNFPGEIYEAS